MRTPVAVSVAMKTRLKLALRSPSPVKEKAVPVHGDVKAACELLGFDPLYVANEGRFAAFVPERDAARAEEILRRHAVSENATIIGRVTEKSAPRVTIRSAISASRILDMPSGEQLPRIC